MKVYISGRITGTDDYMRRFLQAECALQERGYDTVNPAVENAHFPAGTAWDVYMGESLKMLCGCDAIFMMKDWKLSKGAKLEYVVAAHMGKVIMEEEYL